MFYTSLLVIDVSSSETEGQPCFPSLIASNKNLSGLIIAQGVFGLSSHAAACIELLFFLFFFLSGRQEAVGNFYENYDLLAFIPR